MMTDEKKPENDRQSMTNEKEKRNHLPKALGPLVLLSILSMAIALILASCSDSDAALSEIATEKLVRGDVVFKIDIRTELKALKSHKIEAQPFPTVWEWQSPDMKIVKLVPEGTRVKSGDFLLSIDKTDFEKIGRDRRSEVEKAEADLVKARKTMIVELGKLEVELKRLKAEMQVKELTYAVLRSGPASTEAAEAKGALTKAEEAEKCLKADLDAIAILVKENCESQAKLDTAKMDYETAKVEKTLKGTENSFVMAGTTPEALEEARLDVEEARIKLSKAEADLASKERQLQLDIDQGNYLKGKQERQLTRYNRGMKEIDFFASKNGVVTYGKIFQGNALEKIKEGMSIRPYQTIMTIEDVSAMVAEAEIEESQMPLLKPGQKATAELDAIPGDTFAGSVVEIGTIAREPGEKDSGDDWWGKGKKEPSGIRVFDVKVQLRKVDPRLRTGMSGDLHVVVDQAPKVLSLPVEAIFKRGEKSVVYVMKRGKPREREIVAGKILGKRIIIQKGLEEGEEVCLTEPTV